MARAWLQLLLWEGVDDWLMTDIVLLAGPDLHVQEAGLRVPGGGGPASRPEVLHGVHRLHGCACDRWQGGLPAKGGCLGLRMKVLPSLTLVCPAVLLGVQPPPKAGGKGVAVAGKSDEGGGSAVL